MKEPNETGSDNYHVRLAHLAVLGSSLALATCLDLFRLVPSSNPQPCL